MPDLAGADAGEPEFDLSARAGKVAWCKHRAARVDWTVALSSMIQDMDLMGIPLDPAVIQLGMLEGISRGERGIRDWAAGVT